MGDGCRVSGPAAAFQNGARSHTGARALHEFEQAIRLFAKCLFPCLKERERFCPDAATATVANDARRKDKSAANDASGLPCATPDQPVALPHGTGPLRIRQETGGASQGSGG